MNILTFDIEDWFCHDNYTQDFDWGKYEVRIEIGLNKILDKLEDLELKGTFFCLGWIAENQPQIIKQIAKRGHHIGCHSYQHQLSSRFTLNEFYEDTKKAKFLLEDLIGSEVNSFRAPSFSFTEKNLYCLEALALLDFKSDCSFFCAKREAGGLPNLNITKPCIVEYKGYELKEFPMSTLSIFGKEMIFSGGGYFRVIPWVIIDYLFNKKSYNMTYFHPSDFDPDQPSMKQLKISRRIKNEIGLKGSFKKFEKLISNKKFINIESAISNIDWDKAEKFKLFD